MLTGLAERLSSRERRSLPSGSRAAVLVPVIDDGGPLRLIFTRRTEEMPTHKGQVAFPGGGLSTPNESLIAAALREAHEEIGLEPGLVDVLGLLDDIPTVTGTTVVTPVVGRLIRTPTLLASPEEVARIFEVPVSALREPERWTVKHVTRGAQSWPIFFFPWDGEMLWGLSALVTMQFLTLTPGGAPLELPRF